jgi:hypothetical protein
MLAIRLIGFVVSMFVPPIQPAPAAVAAARQRRVVAGVGHEQGAMAARSPAGRWRLTRVLSSGGPLVVYRAAAAGE